MKTKSNSREEGHNWKTTKESIVGHIRRRMAVNHVDKSLVEAERINFILYVASISLIVMGQVK
jgi:hypothetical protein